MQHCQEKNNFHKTNSGFLFLFFLNGKIKELTEIYWKI